MMYGTIFTNAIEGPGWYKMRHGTILTVAIGLAGERGGMVQFLQLL